MLGPFILLDRGGSIVPELYCKHMVQIFIPIVTIEEFYNNIKIHTCSACQIFSIQYWWLGYRV